MTLQKLWTSGTPRPGGCGLRLGAPRSPEQVSGPGGAD